MRPLLARWRQAGRNTASPGPKRATDASAESKLRTDPGENLDYEFAASNTTSTRSGVTADPEVGPRMVRRSSGSPRAQDRCRDCLERSAAIWAPS
jgi:hypothetical protein